MPGSRVCGLRTDCNDTGNADLFRAEIPDDAARITADGGACEQVDVAGGCHGFDVRGFDAETSIGFRASYIDFTRPHIG